MSGKARDLAASPARGRAILQLFAFVLFELFLNFRLDRIQIESGWRLHWRKLDRRFCQLRYRFLHLDEDLNHPNKFRMEVVVASWKQHLLERERMTKKEKEVIDSLRGLRTDPNPPEEWTSLSVEKEVLSKRIRPSGLPPAYID